MRRIFLIWLLILICTAFAVTGGMAYWFFTRHAQQQAEQLMSTRLNDLLELVDFRSRSIQRLVHINDESAQARTRAMAEIVRLNPSILRDQEQLQCICNELGAEQVAVTDDKGYIIAAIPASTKGFDISRHSASQPLLKCIETPGYEHIVRPRGSKSDTDLLYVGVHRHDASGLIRLGFRPYHEYRAREASAFGRLAANHRLGTEGRIIAFQGGSPLNSEALPCPAANLLALPTEKVEQMQLRGQEYFVYAVERGNFRLVGMIPQNELYGDRFRGMRSQLVTNCIVLLAVFALISILLQRYVVRGLERVNRSLRRIADGKLSERVHVTGTPEFARLSTGINSMLDAIKVMDDREQNRVSKELDMARFIQRNALPAPPDEVSGGSPNFSLAADLLPATTVGGDFYDYYLSRDGQQLTFTVAEVSGTGIPAAMLMMRSISILHSLRSRRNPADVAKGANKALCEGRMEDLHVLLFHGIFDIPTGRLTCVNAGYNKPLLQHLGQRQYTEAAIPLSPPLGAAEESLYSNTVIELEAGDRLFFCSRGLLRMQNRTHERFGRARLAEALALDTPTPADALHQLRASLRRFTEDHGQDDDATLFLLEYRGIMRRGCRMEVHAGEPMGVDEMLSEQLESVLAAPRAIDELQAATTRILAALPPTLPVLIDLGCNEELAKLIFTYPGDSLNPLPGLLLPEMESATHTHSGQSNNLILSKKLG